MNILMVLTSHDQLGNTGKKTGFWLEEFAAPYYVFKDAGATITLASPKGGQPPLDPKSDEPDSQTDATRRFKNDPAAQQALANTVKLSSVSADDFDTVFYPGGHGPLWDLAEDRDSIRLIETMYAAGKPVAAVCHAPGVLRHAKGTDGEPLVKGKRVTGFTRRRRSS
jgi:putative intracellular protease/amidase